MSEKTKDELAQEMLALYYANPVIQALLKASKNIQEFQSNFTFAKFGQLVWDPNSNIVGFIDLVSQDNKDKFKAQCDKLLAQAKGGMVALEQLYLAEFP